MNERGPPAERSPARRLRFGVINCDKPPGPSSHQVAAWVRRLVTAALEERGEAGIDDVAHAGTLDPKATGSLPLLLGDATRLVDRFRAAPKEYVAVLELHAPAPTDLEATLEEFEGPIHQRPPRHSAVARRRRVREVYALDALDARDRRVLLRVRCEAGTYVRKLCHDLGLALGTGAHMGDLRRTATGAFDDTDLSTLHDLADGLAFAREGDPRLLDAVVDPAECLLDGLPVLTIPHNAAREVATGAPVYAPGVLDVAGDPERGATVAVYTPDGAAVCVGTLVGDPDGEPDADGGEVVDLDRVLV